VPLIAPDSVSEILEHADLVELIRGRVNLVKRGNRWVGRCPFHEERTPSFSLIPPDNRRYYCHGCGATGDAVRWMMEKEGAASFPDAIEALAERFGITVRYEQASPEEERRRRADQRRLELLDRAATFYAAYLWRADEAAPAREYLRARGFEEELLRGFRVGFAPGGGNVLAARAVKQGYSAQELVEAGLGRLRGNRPSDFFVGRITFPITDLRGRVLGFGARTLDPNERAKYVNSPEGPRFSKRRLLFGLAQARQAAATAGWIVVVEGYTDVMALAKAGIPQAVACMGTSLTAEQVQELRRAAPRIRLCFDGDAAGQRAAWRTAQAAGAHLTDLEAVVLPAGSDPGDLAKGDDLDRLRNLIGAHRPLASYLIESRARRAGPAAGDREEALRDISELLRMLPESVEKDDGIRFAISVLQLSSGMEEHLRGAVRQGAGTGGASTSVPDMPSLGTAWERERRLLVLAAALPGVASAHLANLPDETMTDPGHRAAAALLRDGVPTAAWPDDLQAIAAALEADPAADAATEEQLREVVYRVQLPALERRVQALRDAGDTEGALRMIELVQRVRAALRGPTD
jgi:DNA primase